jgi:ribonuclease PH
VNAASLALADAGIPMRGLVTAVECGSVTGEACADLSSREHSDIVSRLTVATVGKDFVICKLNIQLIDSFSGGKDEICMLDLKNIIHKDHVPQLIKMAMDANAQIHSCLESAVLIHMKKCYALSKRC